MSYNISSNQFSHPLLKPILLELTSYFKDTEIKFFVIGATARDIIMEIHNEKPGRLTHDLDIAIAVNDWSQYQKIEEGILKLKHFTKDKNQKANAHIIELSLLNICLAPNDNFIAIA